MKKKSKSENNKVVVTDYLSRTTEVHTDVHFTRKPVTNDRDTIYCWHCTLYRD